MGFLDRSKPLSHLPRFGDLSDSDMKAVCKAGREVNVPERWSLITESTPPDQVYLVIEGKLEVVHHKERIAELGPGDIVGEIGVAAHRLRTSSVRAMTPLVMLHLTGEAFSKLYDSIPAFKSAVDSTVSERLSQLAPNKAAD